MKYEEVHLKAYDNAAVARMELRAYFRFYNNQWPHQALGLSDSGESVPHRPYSTTEGIQKRGGALYDRSWYHVQERKDPHLNRPQSCPTIGVHLNLPVP